MEQVSWPHIEAVRASAHPFTALCRRPRAEARAPSFFALWGAAVGVGLLGGILTGVGNGIALHGHLKARRGAALRRNGTAVRAEFQNVEINYSIAVNGQNPWRIVAQWKEPSTGYLHLFRSDDIWFDPTRHIAISQITACVDPQDPRRYWMDLSFLPTLAS